RPPIHLLQKTRYSRRLVIWKCLWTGSYQMEECHKLLTNNVDNSILRHNVSKPLPLGGPPVQVTIQSDFFFNQDLEYLRYGSKGSRLALSISKMKAAYYPDKKRRDSPNTPPGSPPHQPPPPPPPAGPSGALRSTRAFGSSQVYHHLLHLHPPTKKLSISLTPADLQMDADMAPDTQAQSSDDEDIGNDHIPKVNLRQDWWKPLEEERPANPEPAWSIPSFDVLVPKNNWASALASTYSPPPEDLLLAQTGDIAMFMD
nr:hypothetical protein [Tanacetum cinerariifolium]